MKLAENKNFKVIFSKEDVETICNFRQFLRRMFLNLTKLENNNTETDRWYMLSSTNHQKDNGEEIEQGVSKWLKRISDYDNDEDVQPFCAAVRDALNYCSDPAKVIYYLEDFLCILTVETERDYKE